MQKLSIGDTCLYRGKQVKIVGFPEKESIWYSENDCMIESDDTPRVVVDKRELALWTSAGVGAWSMEPMQLRTSYSVYNSVPHTGVSITSDFFNAVTKALNSKSNIFWLADSGGASPYEGWDKALEAGIALSPSPPVSRVTRCLTGLHSPIQTAHR